MSKNTVFYAMYITSRERGRLHEFSHRDVWKLILQKQD